MSTNDLMLDVSQAAELKLAFRRNGDWTNADIKTLSEGTVLGDVLKIIRGQAEVLENATKKTTTIDYQELARYVTADGQVSLENFLKCVVHWEKRGEIIYLPPMVSDGTTGEQWIKRLARKGCHVDDFAQDILRFPDFQPTSGVTYHIAVMKGEIFTDDDRTVTNIRAEANKRQFGTPNTEVACLIREKFSDEDLKAMGLEWIIIMHEPINDFAGDPKLLSVNRDDFGRRLAASFSRPGRRFGRRNGFAFVAPQVGACEA